MTMAGALETRYLVKVDTSGQGKLTGLQKGLKGVSNQTNRTATAFNKLKVAGGAAVGVMGRLLPLIGTAAMTKFVSDTLQAGDRLEKFAQSTGVAVPMLDKLKRSSELAGTNFATLIKTFPRLAANIKETSLGAGRAKKAFDELGIKVVDSEGKLRASEQVLLDVADKFKEMEDGTRKASLAYDLFGGKTGEQLIPLLNSGRDAIEAMGTSMTLVAAKRMAAFNDSMTKLKFAFQDLMIVFTNELLPHLEKFVAWVGEMITKFQETDPWVKTVTFSVLALSAPLAFILPMFATIIWSIKTLLTLKLGVALKAWAAGFNLLGASIMTAAKPAIIAFIPLLKPLLIGGAIAAGLVFIGKLIGKLAGHIWLARDQIGAAFQQIGQILIAPFKAWWDLQVTIWTNFINLVKGVWSQFSSIVKRAMDLAGAPVRAFMNLLSKAISKLNFFNRKKRNGSASSQAAADAIPGLQKRYAQGGYVSGGGQLAMVGEGGQPEYVLPSSKVPGFINNYLGGFRGAAAIPRFAQGGYVGSANVSIQTGPVTQMNGQNFVTTQDMSRAVQSGVNQTLSLLRGDMNIRRQVGLT